MQLEFLTGEELRDIGIKQSEDHANAVIPEWVSIPDYPYYVINSMGCVKRLAVTKIKSDGVKMPLPEMEIKPVLHHSGYYVLGLRNDAGLRQFRFHRLIAAIFIPNPNNYPIINHKDGNKTNNAIGNLEWCTVKQNNIHARESGLIKNKGEDNSNAKLNNTDALEIKRLILSGVPQNEIAVKFGIHPGTVSKIKVGKSWKSIAA